jgi:phosphoesterase RecJ-like protein
MNIANQIISKIKNSNKIVITAHKSPDGDSIGSSMALYQFLKVLGKDVSICHPDPSPSFLNWLPEVGEILNFEENPEEVKGALYDADLTFALDYNDSSRLGKEMAIHFDQSSASKIMIDHHLSPSSFAEISWSDTSSCSTCQLIFELIEDSGNSSLLNVKIGEAIYLGIATDTGSFRFNSVTPKTHEIAAKLIAIGVKHDEIHEKIFDINTLDRLKLRGFASCEKLEVLEEGRVAYISLSQDELKRFNYKKGDTEGLVNVALSVSGVKIAVLFSENEKGEVKMSFRSKGRENPINVLASTYFEGGGHANASGGIFRGSLDETISKFKSVISDFC